MIPHNKIAVLYAPGTNCHKETIFVLSKIMGINTELVVLGKKGLPKSLNNFTGLVIPGGFTYGDHFGAGKIAALQIKHYLADELNDFSAEQKPILGICNGFQILTQSGLLPGSLELNNSTRFESRWINLRTSQRGFSLTEKLEGSNMSMPVAHKEGRFTFRSDELVYPIFYYADDDGNPATSYPQNPNGSTQAIAGICDKTGCIIGMMPHPERSAMPHHKSQDGLLVLKTLLKHR